jgi:hypothetical protein
MADRTNPRGEPALVIVDRTPRVYALHAGDGIVSWVFELPSGDAVIVDTAGNQMAQTSLERIKTRQARYGGPRLVAVAERSATVDTRQPRTPEARAA